jgi:putative nucleotidyltransferase with HDIG domain
MYKLLVLIGLPGSGKSTFAKELAEREDAVIFSSDEIGKEIHGEYVQNDGEVLVELRRRAAERLKVGNAIYDATNISSKRRMGMLQQFRNCIKECYYLSTPYDVCQRNNETREKRVSPGIIRGMRTVLQIPVLAEGWDAVHIIHGEDASVDFSVRSREELEAMIINPEGNTHDQIFEALSFLPEFKNITNFAQDSSYHSFTVSRHTFYVYDHLLKTYEGEDKLEILWAGLLHDIGKFHAKNFKDGKRYANFIGHENVSAQIALQYLTSLGYDEAFAYRVAVLCLLHMRLLNADESEKAITKLKTIYGEEIYEKLVIFREADTQAK